MPEFMDKKGRHFTDFSRRISAIRESFEEVNFLLADSDHKKNLKDTESFRENQYVGKNNSDFAQFCKEMEFKP
jgi:hypothetical protein